MAVTNTIFNSKALRDIPSSDTAPIISNGVESYAMNDDEASVFNTYKYWQPFAAPGQPWISPNEKDADGNPKYEGVRYAATKSLFNPFNAVYINNDYRVASNMPLLDTVDSRKRQRDINRCSVADLVNASAEGKMGRQVYTYADFAYCKHLGKMPNNYMITLRRFGAPCGDKIDYSPQASISKFERESQQHMPDMGRMIAWMGTSGNDLSSILTWSTAYEWENMQAGIDQQQDSGEGGMLQSIFNMASPTYRRQVQQGIAGKNFAGKDKMNAMLGQIGGFGDPPYSDVAWQKNYDNRKVYGPLDVVMETQHRKPGLKFSQSFKLVFDYELRSYGGVNGKAAMMDLLSNILCCTYSLGTFWGGERRFYGAHQDNIFANLPIFKLADQGELNNPAKVYDAFTASISEGTKAFTDGIKGESTIEKIKNFAKDLGGMLLGGMLNKLGRPQKFALASLLSPAPTGCWHLTVGNPKNPILEIGNLICKGATVTHYGPLGLDDFPTGLRVEVQLEHGKPRDQMGIEQMYMRGENRVYVPMGDEIIKMYENATEVKISTTSDSIKTTEQQAQTQRLMTAAQERAAEVGDVTENTSVMADNATASTHTTPPSAVTMMTPELTKTLQRYFGTDNKKLIVFGSMESLYGAERHKNDAAKK